MRERSLILPRISDFPETFFEGVQRDRVKRTSATRPSHARWRTDMELDSRTSVQSNVDGLPYVRVEWALETWWTNVDSRSTDCRLHMTTLKSTELGYESSDIGDTTEFHERQTVEVTNLLHSKKKTLRDRHVRPSVNLNSDGRHSKNSVREWDRQLKRQKKR